MSLMSLVQQKDPFGYWCAIGHLPLLHYRRQLEPSLSVLPDRSTSCKKEVRLIHGMMTSEVDMYVTTQCDISAAWRAGVQKCLVLLDDNSNSIQ